MRHKVNSVVSKLLNRTLTAGFTAWVNHYKYCLHLKDVQKEEEVAARRRLAMEI